MSRLAIALRRRLLLTIAVALVLGIVAGYAIAVQRQEPVLDACRQAVRALEDLLPPAEVDTKPGGKRGGLANVTTVDGEIECLDE